MKSALALLLTGFFVLNAPLSLSAKTLYVNAVTGLDSNDGLTADTPLLTLQASVDAAAEGDEILAAAGTYNLGGRPATPMQFDSDGLTNRVSIEKGLTLRASAGPAATFIVGAADASATNGLGPAALRCVYAAGGGAPVVIDGFTLTNGFTAVATAEFGQPYSQGGGARMNGNVILTNCVLTGNSATMGGGAASGTLRNCRVAGNRALWQGGGLFQCVAYNTLIVGNEAQNGGGSVYGSFYSCTVVGNRATEMVGGIRWYNVCYDSIIYYNQASQMPNYDQPWNLNNCCVWPMAEFGGVGLISSEPRFADTNAWSDLHLTGASLCIDAGAAYAGMPEQDLEGQPRPSGAQPDIGAYEWQGAVLPVATLSALQTSLTEDAGAFTLTLSTSAPLTNDTAFALAYGGTAVRGADYSNAPDTVTISNGQSSATIELALADDTQPEYPETLTVSLADRADFRFGALSHTLFLLDNDGMPAVTRFYLNNGSGGISTNFIANFDLAVTNSPTEFVMGEDPSFAGVEWVNYDENIALTYSLSLVYGEKTVWFKVRKPDGLGGYLESLPVSDSIIYGPVLPVALDAPGLTVTTGGGTASVAWFGRTDPTAFDGSWASSAPLPPGMDWVESWMQTTFTLDRSMLVSFDYERKGNGSLEFQLDGQYLYDPDFSPWEAGRHTFERELPPGEHTFRWSAYSYAGAGEGVAGYSVIDRVSFIIPPPRVCFATNALAVAENAGSADVAVLLESPSDVPVTVAYSLGGMASSGGDYTVAPAGSVTFAPGVTRTNLTVTILDDADPEHSETALFTLQGGTGYRVGTPAQHALTILANDGLIDLLSLTLAGGAAETTNRVIRIDGVTSEPPAAAIASENPDFSGSDWVDLSTNDMTFTLSAGYGHKTVFVKVRIPKDGGGWEESNVLSASVNLVACTLLDALDTIQPVVSASASPWFGQKEVSHDGSDAAQSGPVSASAISEMTLTVQGPAKISFWWKMWAYYDSMLSFMVDGSTASYQYGQYYDTSWSQVNYTLPAGTHVLTWQYYQSYYTAGANCGWVDGLRITPDWPAVSFGNASQTVTEDTGSVLIPLYLDRAEANTVTVPYTLGGTATEGADYTVAPPGSVSFAPGETTAWLVASVIDDADPERSETALFTLAPGTGALTGDPATHALTIALNDGAPSVNTFAAVGGASTLSRTADFYTVCSQDPTEFRVSEDPAFTGAAWQPYTNMFPFTVSEGYGAKTVWVQVRKPLAGGGSVESDPAQTGITLNPALAEALGVDTVETGTTSPWSGQTVTTLDGAAAQSGQTYSYGETTWARTTLDGSGTVTFKWKFATGYNYSISLQCLTNGVEAALISTPGDWAEVSLTFDTPGLHTLEWRFYSYFFTGWYETAAYVDQVTLAGWSHLPAATPQFAPPSGTLFTETQQVTLACATLGAQLRYTVDNSEPNGTSTLYDGPLTLTGTTTVRAKAFKPGYPDSEVAEATYIKSNSTPQFSPPSGTVFTNELAVSITSSVATATIRYTLDGSEPDGGSAVYAPPLTLTGTTTVKAKAFDGATPSSLSSSATYTLQAADAPTFTPGSGLLFNTSPDVTLACAVPEAAIRYTLDDSDPTDTSPIYDTALTCTSAMTVIRARAYKAGMTPSAISRAVYFLRGRVLVWGYNNNGECNVPGDLTNAVSLVSGSNVSLSLRPDGTVTAWGYTGYGQCSAPPDLSNAVALSAGVYHSLALRADGTIAAWGYNSNGQCAVPTFLNDAVAVSAGFYHSSAVKADGTVVGWGYNDYGQCDAPTNLTDAVAAAAGYYHTAALRAGGTVVGWGYNGYGQCTPPEGLTNAVALAAGAYHTVALRTDGTVTVWGNNDYGQRTVPEGLSNVIAVAAGYYHTAALKADGTVTAWGYNDYGQCAAPTGLVHAATLAGGGYNTAVRFDDVTPVFATPPSGRWIPPAAGSLAVHLSAASRGGTLRYTLNGSEPTPADAACTGSVLLDASTILKARLFNGSEPDGATFIAHYPKQAAAPVFTPGSTEHFIPVVGTLTVSLSSADSGATIRYTLDGSEPSEASAAYGEALQLDRPTTVKARAFKAGLIPSATSSALYAVRGDLLVWGNNDYSQRVLPEGLTNVVQISAGGNFSLALRADGTATAWGNFSQGQNNIPADLTNAVAVAAGYHHGLALRADSTVTAWGSNSNGQRDVPAGLLDVVALAAGTYNSAALKADGTVTVWGYNGHGQCDPQTGLSNAVAIAVGMYHIAALRDDGTVTAWGYNGYQQCDPPAGLSNVVALAAGEAHTVALKADGTVVAWGYNGYGQCAVPAGLSGVIALSAGGNHTVALQANGTVVAWGNNGYQQSSVPAGLARVSAISAGENHTLVQFGLPSPVVFTPPSGMMVPGSGYPFPVRLSGFTGAGAFRYTLDGSEPAASSPAYAGPIMLGDTTTFKAALFTNGVQAGASATARYPLLPGGVVFHTVTTAASPAEAGTASGGGTVRKNSATTVTATLTDSTGKYVFGRWLLNGTPVSTLPAYTFTVIANSTLTAVFDLATYTVNATVEPYGLGWVYGAGWWSYGVTNTLTAYPYGGCRFLDWRDALTDEQLGTNLTYTLAVSSNLTVKARFEELITSHTVTTRTEPAGLAEVSGAGVYTNGQLGVFTAPLAITNDTLRYVFQYFRMNGGWGSSSSPWSWWLSRTDPADADIRAVYVAQPLSPKVRHLSRTLDTPVPITDNLLASVVFDRQMNPAYPPTVTVSNLAGTVVRTLPTTGTWIGWYAAGDTYRCPAFGFARGEDGDYVLSVANARDTYDGILATTNVWSFRVDATPPPVPALRLTSSNDTWFTVGWADYAPPSDLNGFRVYVSESSFTNLLSLSPVSYLWSGTRAYTRYGIQLDTTYWIAVVPMDQAGNMESAITPLAVRIPRALPPAVPFTVTAAGADSARLDWPTYAGDSLGFAEFRLYQDARTFTTVSNRTPIATVARHLRTHTVTGLDRTVTNWFSVVGFNSRGESLDTVTALPWTDPYQGVITNNLTIGRDGTVTEILKPLIVRAGAVLTVPAGATLAFHPNAGLTIEDGALQANGTALKPIRFTSVSTNAPVAGDWSGVTLRALAGGSLLRHVWLEYGQGLTIDGCSPTVDACTARYNTPAGFSVLAGGTLATRDALLLYNSVAVRSAAGASASLTRSIIRNNVTNALAEAGSTLTATNVWWGSSELATLQGGLSGAVVCEPVLTSEPVLTPAADAADGNRNVGVPSIVLALAGRVAEAVQISEDSLFTGSFYDTFEPLKTVALSAGGGVKTLYIRFRNASGQVSEPVILPVNYITGGPQITACNLAEGSTLTRPFVLTASAWSGLGIATLRVLADDTAVASADTGSLSARWDIRSLAPGTHRIRVEATDTRGNLGTRAFNVTANIQPPPNPALTAPADGLLTTNLSVTATGTAEPFAAVSLRRNGAVVQQVSAAESGAFTVIVPLVEGENVLVATLTDAFGTGRSNERRVTRDSGAPSPVTLAPPSYRPGTGLQIAWQYPTEGEAPSSIALLRSEVPFTAFEEATWQGAWTTDNPLTAVPPGDGRWYFAAVGRDAADNRSPLSNVLTNDYDGTAPSFAVTYDTSSPCGLGLLRITLEASEQLAGLPTLTVQPPASSGPTMLTVSNTAPNRYTGSYNVQSVAGSGPLLVKVSGTDLAGNRAVTVVPSGTVMVLDTRAPSGFLSTTPAGLIQVTNPVPMMVSLTLDEVPSASPVLRFLPPESASISVPLTGGGTNWNGQLELSPSMGSGLAHFTLSVSDVLGNAGTQLGGATAVELYNTALPAPPARVTDLRASTDQTGGLIKLAWLAVADAESYTLYRQAGPAGTTPDQLIAEGLSAATYDDVPPEDGFYRYVVASTRRGAAALPSPQALGISDRTPPPTPQNLTAALSSSGVRVAWEYSGSGEQPEYFRVYRNGTLLRDRVSAATRFILDNPASGTWSYTVSSVDLNANEALSNSASIDMTLPAVVRTDVTVGADLVPRLTWQTRAEHVGVNLYRNGSKLNAAVLTDPVFSDTELTGSGVTRYEVRGVNASGSESAARQLPVYRLTFALAVNPEVSGSALQRYFDRCVLTISNRTAGATFDVAQLDLTRLIEGGGSLLRTARVTQSADAGGATDVGVTYPCATAPGVQSYAATVVQTLDDPSASVRYQAAFQGRTPSLTASQIDVALDTQPLAGAACVPRARIYNRSQVPVDIVMWRNGQPGDLSVRVLDARETEVSRVDVMMARASLTPTPDNLRGYVRIPAKGSTVLTLPEIIVPEALGADASAFIEVNIQNVYTSCGEAGEEISGPLLGRRTITPMPTPYTAFGVPELTAYRAGETLVITGYAFDRVTLERKTNVAVNVGISLEGTAWYVLAHSDASGNFRAEWPIIEGISGLCQVWAAHPQVKDHLNQGQAAIYQAYFRPQEGSVRMAANDVLTIRLNVYNPGSFTFTNLTSAFTAWRIVGGVTNFLPLNVVSGGVSQAESLTLPPKQQVPVTLTLIATEEALPSFDCRFEIVSPEGLRVPFDAAVSVTAPLPLITVATPASGYVDMSLDRGKLRSADVELRNDGFKPLLGVKMTAPTIPWIQVALTRGVDGKFTLPDLAPGQSFTFQVLYAPDDAAEMKYYSDSLSITGTNTVTVKTLNLYAKVTSELRGRLSFHVENTLGQVVPDASVRVRSALDGTERTGFTTDASGNVEIPDLMEGRWHWQVSASGHATQAGTSQVEADLTTEVDTVLTRELVTVTFTVVPVPFTDRYEIKIEQTFSTYVPVPVLVVDPLFKDFGTVSGPFEQTFIATAKNYGLIKMTDFKVTGSRASWGTMLPAISYLPVLAPMQQIEVPFTVTYWGEGAAPAAPQMLALAPNTRGGIHPLWEVGDISDAYDGANSVVDTVNEIMDTEDPPADPPQFDPCRDDFIKTVKQLVAYLAARSGSFSGTQIRDMQIGINVIWKAGDSEGVPVGISTMANAAQTILCLGMHMFSSSGGRGGGGSTSSGGGGGGYGGNGGGCFEAGTPVLMADGTALAIEGVKPGDVVRTGPRKEDLARVAGSYSRSNTPIRELTLSNGQTLRTTDEHRIWVDASGWKLAKDIRAGDRVACTNDTVAAILSVEAAGRTATVYTLELREDTAFYAQGVLVRHRCGMQFPNMTPTHGTPNLTIGGAQ